MVGDTSRDKLASGSVRKRFDVVCLVCHESGRTSVDGMFER